MSRTKTTDITETNPIEESSAEKETVPVETVSENEKQYKEDSESYRKISVIQYLELNPQSVYIADLMKKNYEMKFNSKSDWDLLLQKLIGKKIN